MVEIVHIAGERLAALDLRPLVQQRVGLAIVRQGDCAAHQTGCLYVRGREDRDARIVLPELGGGPL